MKTLSIPILAFVALAVVSPPPTAGATRFLDLTESGSLLRFIAEGPSVVRVELRGDPAADRPVLEVRGVRGERLILRFVELPAGWTARAWTGPGAWRELRVVEHAGGVDVEVDLRSDREVVELRPLRHGFEAAEAGAVTGYTYDQFTAYLAGLPSDPRVTETQLGFSIQGRPIHKVVFDDPNGGLPVSRKRTMVILVRQHGDEWASSYVFEGMLDFLLGRRASVPQREITRATRWVFYPLINPDGAVLDQRGNANGVDLNRDWRADGPAPDQEPEIFLVQSDVGTLPAGNIRSAGDHHGWSAGVDGGYYSNDGGLPVGVTHPAFLEGLADTLFYTAYEPAVFSWTANGGQDGMSRVELYHWRDWVVHTPEYDGGPRDEEALRTTGERYVQAMYDALHGVTLVDAAGGVIREIQVGDDIFVEVDDLDQNIDPAAVETVRSTLRDRSTGDRETLLLTETGADTGFFTLAAPVQTAAGAAVPEDGILQTTAGARVTAQYVDADRPLDNSLAIVRVR